MKVNELKNEVYNLQKQLGYIKPDMTFEESISYVRDLALALTVEISEALNCLPWKLWKPVREQNFWRTEFTKEVADIIVFAIDLMLVIAPDIDLEEVMSETLGKIEYRIKNQNYGKQGV